MEAIRSSETSGLTATRRHIPEDGTLSPCNVSLKVITVKFYYSVSSFDIMEIGPFLSKCSSVVERTLLLVMADSTNGCITQLKKL
jgi:hypothetical protein